MAKHSAQAIYETLVVNGFYAGGKGETNRAHVGTAVILAESTGDDQAKYVNADQWHSIDRGIAQINSHWHPEVSDACAYNFACGLIQFARITNHGRDFSAYHTYTTGAYKAHMNWNSSEAQSQEQEAAQSYPWVRNNPAVSIDPNTGLPRAGTVVQDTKDIINAVPKFLQWVTDPSTWLRLGKGTLGLTFVVLGTGAMVFVVANKTSPGTTSAVRKVAAVVK